MFSGCRVKTFFSFKYIKWRFTSKRLISTDTNHEHIDREFKDLSSEQYACLANNDHDMNQIEQTLAHYQYLKYTTLNVPSNINLDQMQNLMVMSDSSERTTYLYKLYKKEVLFCLKDIENKKLKQAKQIELNEKWTKHKGKRSGIFNPEGQLIYGLWHNSLFTRLSEQNRRNYARHRLKNAALFGQNIVFDFSYEKYMSVPECQQFAVQSAKSHQLNRLRFLEPFNIHFNNIDRSGHIWKFLQRHVIAIDSPKRFINFSQKPIQEIFPDKRLIYIYPRNSSKPLESTYDHNAVYIFGGFSILPKPLVDVDLLYDERVELRKLPINENIVWSGGRKSTVHLDNVIAIFNDLKEGYDWQQAFHRNLPERCIKTPEDILAEDRYRIDKMKRKFGINPSILSNIKELT